MRTLGVRFQPSSGSAVFSSASGFPSTRSYYPSVFSFAPASATATALTYSSLGLPALNIRFRRRDGAGCKGHSDGAHHRDVARHVHARLPAQALPREVACLWVEEYVPCLLLRLALLSTSPHASCANPKRLTHLATRHAQSTMHAASQTRSSSSYYCPLGLGSRRALVTSTARWRRQSSSSFSCSQQRCKSCMSPFLTQCAHYSS